MSRIIHPFALSHGLSHVHSHARVQRLRLIALSVALFVGFSHAAFAAESASSARDQRFVDKRAEIERKFPGVNHITINDYLASNRDALLIDVRANKEFEISHIPGAVHAPNHKALVELLNKSDAKKVVLYCSLGWRSAEAAVRLEKIVEADDLPEVYNLHGSIFEWGNRGLPLENGAGTASTVHPYNFIWGWLYLDPERRH